MMTKYQLVYIKLETTMHKIGLTQKARVKFRMKKAFNKFRMNS